MRDDGDCVLQYFICSAGDDATRLASRIQDQLVHRLYALLKSTESIDTLEKANEHVTNYLGPADAKAGSKEKNSFEDTYTALACLSKQKIYLLIDALDECTDRKGQRFLKMLRNMLYPSNYPEFRFHVIICSRPEPDIEDDLMGKLEIKVEDHNGPDIESAARLRLNAIPGLSSAERALACKAIVGKAKGLFRGVDPAIEFLKKPLQRPLEKALERLPDGLDSSYQQILRQTDPEYLGLLKTALRWSILCERAPTIAEIMDDYSGAYEQQEGSEQNPYEDLDDLTKPEETRSLLSDQIRIAGSSTFLEVSGNTVRTRHTTVTDFFRRTQSSVDPCKAESKYLCSSCQCRALEDAPWVLTRKEGELRMALTICKSHNEL